MENTKKFGLASRAQPGAARLEGASRPLAPWPLRSFGASLGLAALAFALRASGLRPAAAFGRFAALTRAARAIS